VCKYKFSIILLLTSISMQVKEERNSTIDNNHNHLESRPFKLTYMHYDEDLYEELLKTKIDCLKEKCYQFLSNDTDGNSNYIIDNLFIIKSPTRYRQRCRFAIERINNKLTYALFEYGTPSVYLSSYAIASVSINITMITLLDYLNENDDIILNSGLKACTFLSSMQEEVVIALIYDKPLSEEWKVAAINLKEYLNNKNLENVVNISIIGRSRGEKIIYGKDYVYEVLVLKDQTLRYKQMLDGFSNPNGIVNAKALDWICSTLEQISKSTECTLLELYCGNGNHTIALAKYCRFIIAVEINNKLVDAANENLEINSISNAKVVQCDSCKFAKRILKNKRYTIYNDYNDNDNEEVEFNIVLVDPPRAGLDEVTLSLIVKYDYIIYISCNPTNSLLRDLSLSQLISTHEIVKFGVFDHFAYTEHLEAGIFLRRKV